MKSFVESSALRHKDLVSRIESMNESIQAIETHIFIVKKYMKQEIASTREIVSVINYTHKEKEKNKNKGMNE